MKYRSRNEIICEILNTCLEPRTKTRIMYNAYLSYTQVQEYVEHCLVNNLIENQSKTYLITEKGKEFLDLQNKIESMATRKTLSQSGKGEQN